MFIIRTPKAFEGEKLSAEDRKRNKENKNEGKFTKAKESWDFKSKKAPWTQANLVKNNRWKQVLTITRIK